MSQKAWHSFSVQQTTGPCWTEIATSVFFVYALLPKTRAAPFQCSLADSKYKYANMILTLSLLGFICMSVNNHRSDCYIALYIKSLLQSFHFNIFSEQDSTFFWLWLVQCIRSGKYIVFLWQQNLNSDTWLYRSHAYIQTVKCRFSPEVLFILYSKCCTKNMNRKCKCVLHNM